MIWKLIIAAVIVAGAIYLVRFFSNPDNYS